MAAQGSRAYAKTCRDCGREVPGDDYSGWYTPGMGHAVGMGQPPAEVPLSVVCPKCYHKLPPEERNLYTPCT